MTGLTAARRIAALRPLALAPCVHAAGDWHVPDAALRYKVSLTTKPSHTSAGYYVHLPDGGILRGAAPSPTVVTEDGKVIPSFLFVAKLRERILAGLCRSRRFPVGLYLPARWPDAAVLEARNRHHPERDSLR